MIIGKENLGRIIPSRNVAQLWRENRLAMHDQGNTTTKKSNVGLPQTEITQVYDLPFGLYHVGVLQEPKTNFT